MATFSAPRGREARKFAYRLPNGSGAREIALESSACTIVRAPYVRKTARYSSSCSSLRNGNSSTPECSRKHLNPKTPASCSPRKSLRLPGMAPPQKPTSTWHFPSAASRLTSRASTVQVGGTLLSGISMIVVIPPAAAARVAVSKPSQSVRPGSSTWTCVSTMPGSKTSSSLRCTVCSPVRSASSSSIAATMPSRIPTQRGPSPANVMARGARITRSYSAIGFNPCGAPPGSTFHTGPIGAPSAVLGNVFQPLAGRINFSPHEHDESRRPVVQLHDAQFQLRRLARYEPVTDHIQRHVVELSHDPDAPLSHWPQSWKLIANREEPVPRGRLRLAEEWQALDAGVHLPPAHTFAVDE